MPLSFHEVTSINQSVFVSSLQTYCSDWLWYHYLMLHFEMLLINGAGALVWRNFSFGHSSPSTQQSSTSCLRTCQIKLLFSYSFNNFGHTNQFHIWSTRKHSFQPKMQFYHSMFPHLINETYLLSDRTVKEMSMGNNIFETCLVL